jgi:hypothetical protein
MDMENMHGNKREKKHNKKWMWLPVIAAMLCFAFMQYFSARLSP